MVRIHVVTVDGREYQVVRNETHRSEPLAVYCKVSRIRKDGTLGSALTPLHDAYLAALKAAKAIDAP